MVVYYREAHLMKRKMHNEEMWLQGLYNHHAFGAVIASAFGKKREQYIKKPLNVFPDTEIERQEKEREKKRKLINYLSGWKKISDHKKQKQ